MVRGEGPGGKPQHGTTSVEHIGVVHRKDMMRSRGSGSKSHNKKKDVEGEEDDSNGEQC